MEENDKHSRLLHLKNLGTPKGNKCSIMWKKEEDLRLKVLVEKCGKWNWTKMMASFPGRTDKQLAERWRF